MPRERITSETCRSCGLCCIAVHDQPAFCDVTAEDLKQFSRQWTRSNVMFPHVFDQLVAGIEGFHLPDAAIKTKWQKTNRGKFKGFEMCRCVALRGNPGHAVKCSIYEKRPEVCRDAVKPGDKTCREIRRDYDEMLRRQPSNR